MVEMWGTVFCVTLEGGAGGVMILFRNRICSKTFGLSLFLFFETTSPALEKTRSQGTEDAGVHKNFNDNM